MTARHLAFDALKILLLALAFYLAVTANPVQWWIADLMTGLSS